MSLDLVMKITAAQEQLIFLIRINHLRSLPLQVSRLGLRFSLR